MVCNFGKNVRISIFSTTSDLRFFSRKIFQYFPLNSPVIQLKQDISRKICLYSDFRLPCAFCMAYWLLFFLFAVSSFRTVRFQDTFSAFQPYFHVPPYGSSASFLLFNRIFMSLRTVPAHLFCFSTVFSCPSIRFQRTFSAFQPYFHVPPYGSSAPFLLFNRIFMPFRTVPGRFFFIPTELMY